MTCNGQDTTVVSKLADSSNLPKNVWIEKMDKYVTLKFTQTTNEDGLSVFTDQNDILLTTNLKSTSKISANYSFITLSLKFAPKFLQSDNDNSIKGFSKSGGLDLNFNFRHWQQFLAYTRTQGYYLQNTSDYVPGWKEGDPYIQFPDLLYKSFEGATAYSFNSKFSFNALTSQSERQLKSAGSFIPGLMYKYYIVDDRSQLRPGGSRQKSHNFQMILGAGYYHTFVVKHSFYFSLGATPGIGFVHSNIFTTTESEVTKSKQLNSVVRLDARTGIGYNGNRFFSGLYMTVFSSAEEEQHSTVISGESGVLFQFFVGYRLKAPKFLREKERQMNEKMDDALKKIKR
ncbi:DUF4421 family protein [Chitinophagaceae bacterium 26-R-25]|nr:DUF4421 family protein [Chitinophagaceae bacterium 26-R-25]